MWCILCVILALFIMTFNYSASKNNELYDSYIIQQMYFDEYVNNESPILVKYVGVDRCEIGHNQHMLITINTTDDDKIKVGFDDTNIIYDDFKHFNSDWEFKDRE